jgi:iron complex transport system substrate-binding protein
MKVPIFILAAKTVEDIFGHIATVGRLTAHDKQAREVVQQLRERLNEVRRRTASVPKVRVFYVVNTDPLITVGTGSFIHHMLDLAGGDNITGRLPAPYPRITLEEVLRKDPEVIIFPVGASEGIPDAEQQRWRRWTTVSAVVHDRLRQVRSELVNRPGPRVLDGIEVLANAMHPHLFQGSR